jgi:hypothetical protein
MPVISVRLTELELDCLDELATRFGSRGKVIRAGILHDVCRHLKRTDEEVEALYQQLRTRKRTPSTLRTSAEKSTA